MSLKSFNLDSIGNVTVYKRRNNRRINLSVNAHGAVRVSIPTWMPYQTGLNFVRSKESWIIKQRPPKQVFTNAQTIGQDHELAFASSPYLEKPKITVKDGLILVKYPSHQSIIHPEVQAAALKGALKVLRSQAELKLLTRLDFIARQTGLPYKSLKIKRLSRRWGSCDREKNIVLNLYLVQLPDELIDYVICHELTHTKVLNHGADFWTALKQISPQAAELKVRLRHYSPAIIFQ